MKQDEAQRLLKMPLTLRTSNSALSAKVIKTCGLSIFAIPEPASAPVQRAAIIVALRSSNENAYCF
jgi:hypothetical protein